MEGHRSYWSGWRAWAVALLLALPVAWLYLAHVRAAPPGFGPTGFIQYDQLYYLANAREIADRGGWLTYGNPFSPDYATPAVYFQPAAFVLGLLLRLTGADPGVLFVIFGAIAAVACLRLMIALYRTVVTGNDAAAWLGLVLFAWGGGLLALAGLVRQKVAGPADLFAYDPGDGFWFLNLGRNLIFPLEAFYHVVFFAAIMLVLRVRWVAAAACAVLLSASHPFTGIELIGILLGWALLERVVLRRREVPLAFPAALAALLIGHAAYYLVYLATDPEHAALFSQWRDFDAVAPWQSQVLAYVPVALFALLRVAGRERFRAVFAEPKNRLLAVWFAGAIVLVNNDLFLAEPIQPLHFTRGYVWTPLFLLGAPLLVGTLREILARPRASGRIAALAIAALLLSDNIAWFARTTTARQSIYLSADERTLFAWLGRPENRGTVLLADPGLAYAATAYTPLRGWLTHEFNTPYNARRSRELAAFLERGIMPEGTPGTTFLAIRDTAREHNPRVLPAGREARVAYARGTITVWRIAPLRPSGRAASPRP